MAGRRVVEVPYEVSIDHATRTIVVKGTGAGTTADTLRLIDDQQETFRRCPGYNLLYEATGLDIESSPADMMKVAAALFSDGLFFGRLAVVVPRTRLDLARIFAALAHPHDVAVNVFDDVGDALRWLGLEQIEPPTL